MSNTVKPVYVNGLRIGGLERLDETTDSIDNLWRLLYPKNTEEPKHNTKVSEILQQYEKDWQVTFPEDLKRIACWDRIGGAIFHAFPTNNCWITPGQTIWSDEKIGRQWKLLLNPSPEDYMLRIIDENQGCCFWYVGWKKGDTTCRVYVSSDVLPEVGESTSERTSNDLRLTGSSLITFLTDYAKEGAAWYKQHRFN